MRTLLTLVGRYQRISRQLALSSAFSANNKDMLMALAVDYGYIADLLGASIKSEYCAKQLTKNLIGQLRENLNRSTEYFCHEKRNATLCVMAKTIERTMSH